MHVTPTYPIIMIKFNKEVNNLLSNIMIEIEFTQSLTSGYRDRTIENASADVTIAFAKDFSSAGEKLTRSSVLSQKKMYIDCDFSLQVNIPRVAARIATLRKKQITLNIAGNGAYTLIKYSIDQKESDNYIKWFISSLQGYLQMYDIEIIHIRSGGQTGADESGAKAGAVLGIPTLVHAPKGWKYRTVDGIDIADEQQFKERFNL